MPSTPVHCVHCGSEMAMQSDARERSIGGGETRPVPATRFFLECSKLGCRARGPARSTSPLAWGAYRRIIAPIPFSAE